MHRIIASIVVGMAALALAGCSSTDATKGGAASNDGEYKVAIAQYASFPPLDEAVAGFKAALSEAGWDVSVHCPKRGRYPGTVHGGDGSGGSGAGGI